MQGGGRKEAVTFKAGAKGLNWRLNHDSNVSDLSFPYRTSWVHSSELLPWTSCSLHWWLWLIVTWSRIARTPLPVPCRAQSAQVTRRWWSGRIRFRKVQRLKMLLSAQSVQWQPPLGARLHLYSWTPVNRSWRPPCGGSTLRHAENLPFKRRALFFSLLLLLLLF